ncbi:MAG: helix-turn-helix domain-containing protein [Gemmatimonadales bacterium]
MVDMEGGFDRSGVVTVAAVVLPAERPKVEAAGNGWFSVLHRDSIPEAIRAVRERPVDAILVSVHRCDSGEFEALGHLVRDFPGIPTVALVSQHDPATPETLLHLGATGVRQVVDVTSPAGWQCLRQMVGHPASRAAARIQAPILAALCDVPPSTRLFFEVMIRLAPEILTVRELADRLQVRASTLMSRFQRAQLPSPKNYLAAIRLLHATLLFERRGLSVADVAYRLDYSSPQSFGRHVRSMLGITTSELRRRFPFPAAQARFIELMITPYLEVLRVFHPLAAGTWDSGH